MVAASAVIPRASRIMMAMMWRGTGVLPKEPDCDRPTQAYLHRHEEERLGHDIPPMGAGQARDDRVTLPWSGWTRSLATRRAGDSPVRALFVSGKRPRPPEFTRGWVTFLSHQGGTFDYR